MPDTVEARRTDRVGHPEHLALPLKISRPGETASIGIGRDRPDVEAEHPPQDAWDHGQSF